MNRRTFLKTTGIIAANTAVFSTQASAAEHQPQQPSHQPPQPPINPFEQQGSWYKSALHVHTTTSDGDVDVPTRIAQYQDADYDIVAVTDHWKTNDLTEFTTDKFLAINGMEAHPQTGTGASAHHFVCLDLPHPFELARDLPAQELINKVLDVGGKVIYAHPYWTAHTLAELLEVDGYIAVEVYNSHCDLASAKGYSYVHIDKLLNTGKIVALPSVDDIHRTNWIDWGWTMIKSKSLSKTDVMDAIAKGSYYGTCGPEIKDCRIEDGKIKIDCSPVAQIRFLFNGAGGGRMYRNDDGTELTTAEWNFSKNRRRVEWVRAEIIDKEGKYAWTNPFVVA